MRYYTDRQVTSPTCGLPPPSKQALRDLFSHLAEKINIWIRQKAQENSRQEETYTLTVYIKEDIHPFTKLSFYETGRKRKSLSMHFAQIRPKNVARDFIALPKSFDCSVATQFLSDFRFFLEMITREQNKPVPDSKIVVQ